MRATFTLLTLTLIAKPLLAQSEDRIRAFFEGKSVRVRIEMPGTSEGVDVYPATSRPIDFPKLATRLKQYGTALRRGDEVLVTKVRLKKDLIEFQLGGGGYGTLFDDNSSYVSVPTAAKSQREKNLEREVKTTTDPTQRQKLSEELDALKRQREREDARNQAAAAPAQQAKEANLRQRRLEGGSRFNLRYTPAVPDEAVTPDAIMRALAEYVDFSTISAARATGTSGAGDGGPADLRKGLTVAAVDSLLGRPEAISQRMEGTLAVSTATYRTRDWRITAEFVEGVLIRFTITSP